MFCPNCGTKQKDNATFCASCGCRIKPNVASPQEPTVQLYTQPQASTPSAAPSVDAQPVIEHNMQPSVRSPQSPAPVKRKSKGILIAIISVAMVLIIALACWFLFLSDNALFSSSDNLPDSQVASDSAIVTPSSPADDASKPVPPPPPQRPDVEDKVNSLINSRGLSADVAVAVIDNISGEKYVCNGAYQTYTSWGFYLPVYMAFCDYYPNDYQSYKNDIMSSDAGKCNSAANFAIDSMGGTFATTQYLKNSFGLSATSMGRKYGETNAYGDNYTNAFEAVELVYSLNQRGEYSRFCYNPSAFGVSVPYGATMYCQIGTENRGVMNNLNVFAIVKGADSDYSVVVLTQNNASANGFVNEILNTVHTCMEG